jgi:transcription initiation factor IIE alpha subunit
MPKTELPKPFSITEGQILDAIPNEGIDELILAIDLGCSLVELRQALKNLAKRGLLESRTQNEWDKQSQSYIEYVIWSIKL